MWHSGVSPVYHGRTGLTMECTDKRVFVHRLTFNELTGSKRAQHLLLFCISNVCSIYAIFCSVLASLCDLQGYLQCKKHCG